MMNTLNPRSKLSHKWDAEKVADLQAHVAAKLAGKGIL
jgi:hypothetical protein